MGEVRDLIVSFHFFNSGELSLVNTLHFRVEHLNATGKGPRNGNGHQQGGDRESQEQDEEVAAKDLGRDHQVFVGDDAYQQEPCYDGIDGRAIILKKLDLAKKWLQNSWNIDIDKLRTEIIDREAHISDVIN